VSVNEYQVGKLLIAVEDNLKWKPHLFVTTGHVHEFLAGRFQKYQRQKFADRMRFPSELVQHLIACAPEIEAAESNALYCPASRRE
jgi:hypothetical protein